MVADALLRRVVVAELAIDLVTVASIRSPGDRINLLESSALPVIRKVFEGPFGSPLSGPLISGRNAEKIISDSMIAPSAFEGGLRRNKQRIQPCFGADPLDCRIIGALEIRRFHGLLGCGADQGHYTCIIAAHDAASGTYEERVDIPIIVGRFLLLKSLDFAQGAAYGLIVPGKGCGQVRGGTAFALPLRSFIRSVERSL